MKYILNARQGSKGKLSAAVGVIGIVVVVITITSEKLSATCQVKFTELKIAKLFLYAKVLFVNYCFGY